MFQPAPACTPPGGTQAPSRTARVDASLVAQQVATWPETGIGLLYSHARDARVCLSAAADYYVAVHADNIAGTSAMTLGDIVLTPGFSISKDHLRRLIGHEAKHRVQWAAGMMRRGRARGQRRPASPHATSELAPRSSAGAVRRPVRSRGAAA